MSAAPEAPETAAPHAASAGSPPAAPLRASLEALLIIATDAMTASELAAVADAPVADVEQELSLLAAEYSAHGRGFELRQTSGAWRFYSAAHCSAVVSRWAAEGHQSRLSQAALETLAVIAYRQPVARGTISSIRGVSVDAVVRTLQVRGLVAQCGEHPITGAVLYGTTDYFLDRMGMGDLAELPPIVHLLPNPEEVTEHIDGEALDLP